MMDISDTIYTPQFVLGALGYWAEYLTYEQNLEKKMNEVTALIHKGVRYFDNAHYYYWDDAVMGKVIKYEVFGMGLQRYKDVHGELPEDLFLFGKVYAGHEDIQWGEDKFSVERGEAELCDLEVAFGRKVDCIFIHGQSEDGSKLRGLVESGAVDWLIEQKNSGRMSHIGLAGAHTRAECVVMKKAFEMDVDRDFDFAFVNYGIGFDETVPEVADLLGCLKTTDRNIMFKKLFNIAPQGTSSEEVLTHAIEFLREYSKGYICTGMGTYPQIAFNALFIENYEPFRGILQMDSEFIRKIKQKARGHVREIVGL